MTIFILFIALVISLLAFAYLWVDSFDDLEELPSQKKTKRVKRPRKWIPLPNEDKNQS